MRRVGRLIGRLVAVVVLAVTAVGSTSAPSEAAYPGDEGALVFVSPAFDGSRPIVKLEPGSTTPTTVYDCLNRFCATPSISADGQTVVFMKLDFDVDQFGNHVNIRQELYRIGSDGTGLANISNTPSPEDESRPAVSPDGLSVAYDLSNGGHGDIYLSSTVGGARTRLTTDGQSYAPTFSPDGTRIAYQSASPEGQDIFVMNVDGSGAHQVTHVGTGVSPDFSPDGTKLTFIKAGPAADNRLWIVGVDGSDAHQLGGSNPQSPSFSPDGSRIVFTDLDDGPAGTALYTIGADGTGYARFFQPTFQYDYEPVWAPVPVVPPPPPTQQIGVGTVTAVEGDSLGARTMSIPVVLSQPSDVPVVVDLAFDDDVSTPATAGATHGPGVDYRSDGSVRSVTFTPGPTGVTRTVAYVKVAIYGDTIDEDDEGFTLHPEGIHYPSGPPSGGTYHIDGLESFGGGWIVDDDDPGSGPVEVGVGDVTAFEGDAGDHAFVFPIALSTPQTDAVAVDYQVVGDTATCTPTPMGYDDCRSLPGVEVATVTFAPGSVSRTVQVVVRADDFEEAFDETFHVVLSNARDATTGTPVAVGRSTGTGDIHDSDDQSSPPPTPSLVVGQGAVVEGNSVGPRQLLIPVSLSSPSDVAIDVDYSLATSMPFPEMATPGSSAASGVDYRDSGAVHTVSFRVGRSGYTPAVAYISIPVFGDTVNESTTQTAEYVRVHLTDVRYPGGQPSAGTFSWDPEAAPQSAIVDDDRPTVAGRVVGIAPVVIPEGATDSRDLRFSVTLAQPIAHSVSVDYTVTSASASCVVHRLGLGEDCLSESGTLHIGANQLATRVVVTAFGDLVPEGVPIGDLAYPHTITGEYFSVELSNARDDVTGTPLEAWSGAAGIIMDDDS